MKIDRVFKTTWNGYHCFSLRPGMFFPVWYLFLGYVAWLWENDLLDCVSLADIWRYLGVNKFSLRNLRIFNIQKPTFLVSVVLIVFLFVEYVTYSKILSCLKTLVMLNHLICESKRFFCKFIPLYSKCIENLSFSLSWTFI